MSFAAWSHLLLQHAVRNVIASLLVAVTLLPGPSLAQVFPTQPVRILSPYSPGIQADITMRLIAAKLTQLWGQTVVVDSKPGGNGLIAMDAAKRARADGHTLLLLGKAHLTTNPTLLPKQFGDIDQDFVPVAQIYEAPFFYVVANASPYKRIDDLLAAAASHPEGIAYASPYVGSPPHIAGAMLAHLSRTRMLAVHYKDAAQLATSVPNGDVAFRSSNLGTIQPLVTAGKLRVIAVASDRRHPMAPNVPTVAESGGPKGIEIGTWGAVVAPIGTPASVIARINSDVRGVMDDPEVKARYRGDGIAATPISPQELADVIKQERTREASEIKALNIDVR
jgi:tripartite-type tricarboxylate transporter receptor subunit TctC